MTILDSDTMREQLFLYETIRWGNDSDDVVTGGPNGPDTCFLVRAATVQQAAYMADVALSRMPHEHVDPWCHAIYLLGADSGVGRECRILRGPYVQSAYSHGWRSWGRSEREEAWTESEPGPGSPRREGARRASSANAGPLASTKQILVQRVTSWSGYCLLHVRSLDSPATFRWRGHDVVTGDAVLAWTSEKKRAIVLEQRDRDPHAILVLEEGALGLTHAVHLG